MFRPHTGTPSRSAARLTGKRTIDHAYPPLRKRDDHQQNKH
jgi:hypothetical protein